MIRMYLLRNDLQNRPREQTVVRKKFNILVCHQHTMSSVWKKRKKSNAGSWIVKRVTCNVMLPLSAILILASFFHLPQLVTMFLTLFAIFFLAARLHFWLPSTIYGLRSLDFLLNVGVILATQSILQTAWYYLDGKATTQSDLIILAIISLFVWMQTRRKNLPKISTDAGIPQKKTRYWFFLSLFCVALVATAFVLWQAHLHATTDAIRAPWSLFPHGTLTLLALVGICAILAARSARSSLASSAIPSLAILSITALAAIIYQNGYGYDGFIHRASEQVFLQNGTLVPKPPYYIGQYVFVTWIARTFHFPLSIIDTLLVPFAALFLPLAASSAFPQKSRSYALAGLAFLLPFSAFIATTPQSFSYLLGASSMFLALSPPLSPFIPTLFALWAVAAHPLGGLPFLGCVAVLLLQRRAFLNRRLSAALQVASILFTILSVPLAFAIHLSRADIPAQWNFSVLTRLPSILSASLTKIFPTTHASLWADWATFIAWATPAVLFSLASYASIKNHDRRRTWLLLLILGAGTTVAGILLHLVGDFSFLIDYERGQYAERLFVIAEFLLLPAALDGFAIAIKHLFRQPKINIVAGILLLAAWRAGVAYLSLPRHDAAVVGHGWSVGRADQEAVRWIDQDASGRPYTVLANQSVSAAAVEAFGFKRYADDIFYYPVPTGGKLYQLYLRAVEKNPTR